jgi:hypothetical protein
MGRAPRTGREALLFALQRCCCHGSDGSGGYLIRRKTSPKTWVDAGQFPSIAAAKQSLRPPCDIDAYAVMSGRGEAAVPAIGDRWVIGRAAQAGKIRVLIGRRQVEPLTDGRTAVIEWTREGWIVRGIFDTPSDAEAAQHEPRLLP